MNHIFLFYLHLIKYEITPHHTLIYTYILAIWLIITHNAWGKEETMGKGKNKP